MDRSKKNLVFLDTHVSVWLFDGLTRKLSRKTKEILEANPIRISPMVKLELQYLYEIHKINETPQTILAHLEETIDASLSESKFQHIIDIAQSLEWTRDAFDRLLVAEAKLHDAYLVSADKLIKKNYSLTII